MIVNETSGASQATSSSLGKRLGFITSLYLEAANCRCLSLQFVRLVHIGPDGMKVDPFFNVDLNKFPTGPARGHDMLIN